MDVKKEGMMDGMMGDMMHYNNPQELLMMIRRHEQKEVALYRELAQGAPSACLKQMILYMAEKEARHAQKYTMLAELYGHIPADHPGVSPYPPGVSPFPPGMPPYPPGVSPFPPGMPPYPPGTPPQFYGEQEKKDKK